MERWTGTPEGTCNVLRMFRETHAISARSSSTTRIREKALRNESLDRSNARDSERVVRLQREVDVVSAFSSSTSQDVSPNSTSQAERQNTKNQHTSLQLVCCSFFFLIEPLNVPYELLYDECLESQLTMRKYFPLSLNRRILRPRYVEYPHQPLYYG